MNTRVLVINDSPSARAAIRVALADEPDLSIVGELSSGKDAAESVQRLAPNVVLMDIVMPDVDGYEATRRIVRETGIPVVMISANVTAGDVAVAMEALRAGAIAVLETPPAPDDPRYEVKRRAMVHTLRSASALPPRRRMVFPVEQEPPPPPNERRQFAVVGIVASLGGPPVVAEVLGALAAGHPPVTVVQHIEPSFVNGFCEWLRSTTNKDIRVAVDGEELVRGVVYLAPADRHLTVAPGGRARLGAGPPVGGFRPSGTLLLRSLASAYGRRALGIVLTGMGQDGADGALAIRRAGGYVIAQDATSCAASGMTNAARGRDAVDVSLPPAGIAAYVT